MKRRLLKLISAAVLCAVLAGCGQDITIPDPEIMPTVTSITEPDPPVITTVDYVYTSSTGPPPPVNNSIDMPEFPEFPSVDLPEYDNPFDDSFYEYFDDIEFPDFSVAAEDDSDDQLPARISSVTSERVTEISVSDADIPKEEMTQPTPAVTTVSEAMPEVIMPVYDRTAEDVFGEVSIITAENNLEQETMDTFDSIDIYELMPDMDISG